MTKTISGLLLTALLFTACTSGNQQQQEQATTDTENHHHSQPQEEAQGLSLNNGAKWKADSSTNQNVAALQNIMAVAHPTAIEHYQATGKLLQAGLDKMISECRMQGADHEALHQWLQPVMTGIQHLQQAATQQEAETIYSNLDKQLQLYQEYFE